MAACTEAPTERAANQRRLVEALLEPRAFPHEVGRLGLLETHISFVVLTGPYAYKIKKPLDLGFLDYSTLARRRLCCDEELRLNRRLAPDLYLDVVPIVGTAARPHCGGDGEALEYAVKMAEFPQENLLDRWAARGDLSSRQVDRLAVAVADFHCRIAVAAPDDPYGDAEAVRRPMDENFVQIGALVDAAERHRVDRLAAWSHESHARLRSFFDLRRAEGFVRECHGDLHLGNIVLIDNEPRIFDGIEFNPNLRWIDVINDIAFLFMDLEVRGYRPLAYRFVNAYLERGGDYAGLRGLRYYAVYRALVRAKVDRIRASQAGLGEAARQQAIGEARRFLDYARQATTAAASTLIITHGPSGAGKTQVAQALLERLGAIRLRSDVERKRLQGLAPLACGEAGIGDGLYAAANTEATYAELARLARLAIEAGFPVVVDAAFLERWQRDLLRALAEELHAHFLILDCSAPPAVLRARVAERARQGDDASDAGLAVLEHQLRSAEPLSDEERVAALAIDTAAEEPSAIAERVVALLAAGG